MSCWASRSFVAVSCVCGTTDNLHISTDKTTTTPFTPDPAKYGTTLSLKLNNQTLPTIKHPQFLGITLDLKLTFSQHINVYITNAKQTLNILKNSLLPNEVNKRNYSSLHSKQPLAPFWNKQTPYEAPSHQTPTSRNCKPFKTHLCELLLVAHETQTLNTYTKKPRYFRWRLHLKLHATQLKQLTQTQTHPLHDLNAYLDLP